MKRAKIIKGDPFEFGIDMFDNIYSRSKRVDFLKLKQSCPGYVACPKCGEIYLIEGEILECECGYQFRSDISSRSPYGS